MRKCAAGGPPFGKQFVNSQRCAVADHGSAPLKAPKPTTRSSLTAASSCPKLRPASTIESQPQITGDGLLMLGDRRLPFAVELDQPCIKPQLRSAEANQFLDELKGLLLRETVKEPDKGDLVGKAKPVMGAPALVELHEIFLGQGGGALELVAGKH